MKKLFFVLFILSSKGEDWLPVVEKVADYGLKSCELGCIFGNGGINQSCFVSSSFPSLVSFSLLYGFVKITPGVPVTGFHFAVNFTLPVSDSFWIRCSVLEDDVYFRFGLCTMSHLNFDFGWNIVDKTNCVNFLHQSLLEIMSGSLGRMTNIKQSAMCYLKKMFYDVDQDYLLPWHV